MRRIDIGSAAMAAHRGIGSLLLLHGGSMARRAVPGTHRLLACSSLAAAVTAWKAS